MDDIIKSLENEKSSLIKLSMKVYIENFLETKEGKRKTEAYRLAILDFIKTMTEKELYCYSNITFENGETDFKLIFDLICKLNSFKDIENKYIKNGYAGLGVFDEKEEVFYSCDIGEHWKTIRLIIKENYSHLYDALRKFRFKDINEFEGITRNELDDFIMSNFLLIGEARPLVDYL